MGDELADAAFRSQMRLLARKGGAATKRRRAHDPSFYREIGSLGGRASVAARKARIAKSLEPDADPAAIVSTLLKPAAAPIIVPVALPAAKRMMLSLDEIMGIAADLERPRK